MSSRIGIYDGQHSMKEQFPMEEQFLKELGSAQQLGKTLQAALELQNLQEKELKRIIERLNQTREQNEKLIKTYQEKQGIFKKLAAFLFGHKAKNEKQSSTQQKRGL